MTKEDNSIERPFEAGEMFYSATDKRGIIISGNKTFFRISGYTEEEAVGKPHNIIRHRDMPKAVFSLLWSTIKKDLPIAAYVKNRAVDGSYYWVLATVFPVPDGYVSIRVKPLTEFFNAIPGLYAEMCAIESSQNVSMAVDHLDRTLRSLGYSDYRAFMTKALVLEIGELTKVLAQKTVDSSSVSRPQLAESLKKIASISGHFVSLNAVMGPALQLIEAAFESLKSISLNMALAGVHLGQQAAAINVISDMFLKLSDESKDLLDRIRKNHVLLRDLLTETEFKVASTYLQSIMLSELKADQENSKSKVAVLSELTRSLLDDTANILAAMIQMLCRFIDICDQIEQSILALQIVRLSGQVESAQIDQGTKAVGPYLLELESKITDLLSATKEIEGQSLIIKGVLSNHFDSARQLAVQFS